VPRQHPAGGLQPPLQSPRAVARCHHGAEFSQRSSTPNVVCARLCVPSKVTGTSDSTQDVSTGAVGSLKNARNKAPPQLLPEAVGDANAPCGVPGSDTNVWCAAWKCSWSANAASSGIDGSSVPWSMSIGTVVSAHCPTYRSGG